MRVSIDLVWHGWTVNDPGRLTKGRELTNFAIFKGYSRGGR